MSLYPGKAQARLSADGSGQAVVSSAVAITVETCVLFFEKQIVGAAGGDFCAGSGRAVRA